MYMLLGRLKSILQKNNDILMFYHKPLDLIMIDLLLYTKYSFDYIVIYDFEIKLVIFQCFYLFIFMMIT